MLHWIAIILGIIFTLFQLFYAFIVICSLIEINCTLCQGHFEFV